MSYAAQYSLLEKKVMALMEGRGATAEKAECLDQMDRLWAQMTPEEQRQARGQTCG
jgi:uncharacterized protein YbdZ (MbtH family)